MAVAVTTHYILDKVSDGGAMTREEALALLRLPLHSDDCYLLMATANRFSEQSS